MSTLHFHLVIECYLILFYHILATTTTTTTKTTTTTTTTTTTNPFIKDVVVFTKGNHYTYSRVYLCQVRFGWIGDFLRLKMP